MSLRDKLMKAATFAVAEERGRVLWCVDQVLIELRAKLNTKLLSSVQLEAIRLKIRIADAVCMELRRAIVSGVRPPASPKAVQAGVTGQADVADTFPQPVKPAGPEV